MPTPLELARALATRDKPVPAPTPVARPASPFGGADTTSYALAALASELDSVSTATEGGRNHALNVAAFSLGQLVAGGVLDETVVRDGLTMAAEDAGLERAESARTIESGMKGGALSPRDIPERATEIAPPVEPVQAADPGAWVRGNLPILDWQAVWADTTSNEWIVEPLIPSRSLVALYSAPKCGKSLLMLEIAAAIAAGREVLGVTATQCRVLYVDHENDPLRDIRTRLQAMGYGADDLGGLKYLSYPNMAALDSERGGFEIAAAAKEYDCAVVIIDTVGRTTAGEENANTTWLAWYRHTGMRLKRDGRTVVRLDHTGKDAERGQRGASAKSGDVDAIWHMSAVTDTTIRLDLESSRMPIAERTLVLHRVQGPLRHKVDALGRAGAWTARVDELKRGLDTLRVPREASLEECAAALRRAGMPTDKDPLKAAIAGRSLSVF